MREGEWKSIVAAVGVTCRNLRHTLNWSQQHLADMAVVSQGAVSRLEAARMAVPFFTIVKVLRVLGDGLMAAELPVSPAAGHLLNFVQMISGDFSMGRKIDSQLTDLIRCFNKMSLAQKTALVNFLHTVTREDGDDTGRVVPVQRPVCEGGSTRYDLGPAGVPDKAQAGARAHV